LDLINEKNVSKKYSCEKVGVVIKLSYIKCKSDFNIQMGYNFLVMALFVVFLALDTELNLFQFVWCIGLPNFYQ